MDDEICSTVPPIVQETKELPIDLGNINSNSNQNFDWNGKNTCQVSRPNSAYDARPDCPGYKTSLNCGRISVNNLCGARWGRCSQGFCTDVGVCVWRDSAELNSEVDLGNNNNNNNNNNSNVNVNFNKNYS